MTELTNGDNVVLEFKPCGKAAISRPGVVPIAAKEEVRALYAGTGIVTVDLE